MPTDVQGANWCDEAAASLSEAQTFRFVLLWSVWGERVEKSWVWATICSVISIILVKTTARPFLALMLRGYTIAVITSMCQACRCGRVRAKGPTPSAPKQSKLHVHVRSWNPFSAKSPLTKVKKRNNIESTAKQNCACECTDVLSIYKKKQYMTFYVSQPWSNFLRSELSLSDCLSWISRQDKIY